MQAGLTKKRLTFRDVFMSVALFLRLTRIIFDAIWEEKSCTREVFPISMAA